LLHTLRHGLNPLLGRKIGNQGLDATAFCGGCSCQRVESISAPRDRDHRLPASREHARKLQADA
jgi:hypothetical protein